jgi:hypothetical protein
MWPGVDTQEQFCSGTSIDSVNIMMADVSPKTVGISPGAHCWLWWKHQRQCVKATTSCLACT